MPEFGDVSELTIDGDAAAVTSGTNDKISATLYAIDKDGNFAFGFGATKAGEQDEHADLIKAIVSSVSFTPSE